MKFYGELLIFILLLITNLRVFFVNHVRRDPLVVMAPLTFIIAILQLYSWGIESFTLLAFIISFFVLLSNFHAIFRYIERLYVDHYSPLMKIWAIFTSIISGLSLIAVLIFAPCELNNNKLKVIENRTRYKGSFSSGFETASSFSIANVIFHTFEKDVRLEENPEKSKGIIMFIPDKRGETQNYKPYLQLLAKEGYTVCSADFYVDDCKWMHTIEDLRILRRSSMICKSLLNNQTFMSQREFYTYNFTMELNALQKMIYEKFGENTEYYLVSDVMANDAIKEFTKKPTSTVKGIFTLDEIPYYYTAGFGCVEQTSPLLSIFLGVKRDSKLLTPKLLVSKTVEEFSL